jgi:alpha-methylacyl-CoA racemase
MTGWGQDGPLASRAGHDINYVALSGVLGMLGRSGERPAPPLNIIGDMGGGGLLLAFGIVCALLEARRSGRGQVVDASMVEGSALLASTVYELRAAGWWSERRGSNLLDSGAPFYEVYATADGGFMAVGAIEPQFYAALLDGLGLDAADLPAQLNPAGWPQLKERFAAIFRTRTRAEWSETFEGTDACVTPVLTLAEAALHPHNTERHAFLRPDGVLQAAPAPRFSRSRPEMRLPPPEPGEHTESVLGEFGFGQEEIAALRRAGAVA